MTQCKSGSGRLIVLSHAAVSCWVFGSLVGVRSVDAMYARASPVGGRMVIASIPSNAVVVLLPMCWNAGSPSSEARNASVSVETFAVIAVACRELCGPRLDVGAWLPRVGRSVRSSFRLKFPTDLFLRLHPGSVDVGYRCSCTLDADLCFEAPVRVRKLDRANRLGMYVSTPVLLKWSSGQKSPRR